MAENERKPPQQPENPQRQTPGQQQQQGQPREKQNEPGREPGGKVDQKDNDLERRGER